jgi:peptide/nickel transport system substrate-binding protein
MEEFLSMKRKSLLIIGLVMVLVLSLVGACAKPAPAPAPPIPAPAPPIKDTLVIGIAATPVGIDPDVNAEPAGSDIQGNIYDWGISLKFAPSTQPGMQDVMVPNLREKSLEGALIESWEMASDCSKCTFHLRKGVKSAYGNELTTKDILWKTERNFALKANGEFMYGVINITSVDSLKIIDDYTFELTPNKPTPLLAEMWSNLYFPIWDSTECKKHATADDPWAHDWVALHGGGFGSYYITEWLAGEEIVAEANPYAWRKPAIKKLIFRVIPESSSRVAMIKDGTIDVAHWLSPREIDSLVGVPGVKVINLQGNLDLHLVMNQGVFEPFKNKLVRQAIQWAIPQDDVVKLAYYGQAIPWKATIPSLYPGVDTSGFAYSYNPDKGKQLMAQAGYPNGFEVDLYYNADFIPHETVAILLKDSLAKIGITVNLRKTPAGAFDTGVREKNFPFSLWNDYPCIPDPFYSYGLSYLGIPHYHCYSNWTNAEIDAMIHKGYDIVDLKERYAFGHELEMKLLDFVGYGMICEQNYTDAIRDNIKGFNWDVSNNVRYDFMSFTK